ncbi:hypothetical protein Sjap_023601 [Stephania japonica]|uniref:Uncharacterized protein n=1 Tax=Stephania japonica TaxID=461633 RepID=A0AAP0EBY4_9MAGN
MERIKVASVMIGCHEVGVTQGGQWSLDYSRDEHTHLIKCQLYICFWVCVDRS